MSAPTDEHLSLYQTRWCGYCEIVRRVIDQLGVDMEMRDTSDPKWRHDLIAARGRGTVPVLRVQDADGVVRWMPESRDIIAYLRDRFG